MHGGIEALGQTFCWNNLIPLDVAMVAQTICVTQMNFRTYSCTLLLQITHTISIIINTRNT